jgi:hypothetical protein
VCYQGGRKKLKNKVKGNEFKEQYIYFFHWTSEFGTLSLLKS